MEERLYLPNPPTRMRHNVNFKVVDNKSEFSFPSRLVANFYEIFNLSLVWFGFMAYQPF